MNHEASIEMLWGLQLPHLLQYNTRPQEIVSPLNSQHQSVATEALRSTERSIKAQTLVVINFPALSLISLKCSNSCGVPHIFCKQIKHIQNLIGRKLAGAATSLLTQVLRIPSSSSLMRFETNGQVGLFRSNLFLHESP